MKKILILLGFANIILLIYPIIFNSQHLFSIIELFEYVQETGLGSVDMSNVISAIALLFSIIFSLVFTVLFLIYIFRSNIAVGAALTKEQIAERVAQIKAKRAEKIKAKEEEKRKKLEKELEKLNNPEK